MDTFVKQVVTSDGLIESIVVSAIAGTDVPVFGASGGSHSQGSVPDPGGVAGTGRYLREDATWVIPPVTIGATVVSGTAGYVLCVDGSGLVGQSKLYGSGPPGSALGPIYFDLGDPMNPQLWWKS